MIHHYFQKLAWILAWPGLLLLSMNVSAAASVNLAMGKSYSSSVASASSYPDTNGAELTDGTMASGGYLDSAWQGRANASTYSHTIDLRALSQIEQVSCGFLQDTQASIYWPGAVTFSFSKDGISFTAPINAVAQLAAGATKKYLVQPATAIDAQFIRMEVNGTAWVFEDELQAWGTSPSPQILAGSFIQPWVTANWTTNNFSTELSAMRGVAMDHLIWQWTADSKEMTTYYPTSLPGFHQLNSVDSIGISLAQARQSGVKVWLGLNINSDWWSKYANDQIWLENEFNISRQVAQELWNRYGGQYGDVIAGFYLPQEVDNWNFTTTTQQARLTSVYKATVEYIHTHTNKPVLISPFFNESGGQSATQYGAMWQDILATVPIDVIALQDGIGVGHASLSTVGAWFSAFRDAIASARPTTELWSDLETFTSSGDPAPVDRIALQINAEKEFVKTFTSFSFASYMSPQQGFGAEYADYKDYVDSLLGVTEPLTIQFSSPSPGSSVSGTVVISAIATDDVTVTRMEIYVDNALKATSLSGSIAWSWRTKSAKSGSHSILVKAYNADNQQASLGMTVYK